MLSLSLVPHAIGVEVSMFWNGVRSERESMYYAYNAFRLLHAASSSICSKLQMLRNIRLTNQKIEFYKLTNQKMFWSIRSVKWTAAYVVSEIYVVSK